MNHVRINKDHFVKEHRLFCPGPVNIADSVKRTLVTFEVGHREKEFCYLLQHLTTQLLRLYGQEHNRTYQAIVTTGSGTSANETLLSSILRTGNLLALTNGEFGTRLYEVAKIHYSRVHKLEFAWGERIDLTRVEAMIKKLKPRYISMVHHETSTGMLNPIYEVGALAKKYNALFLVDTVSSGGAELIDIERANIAFCTGSSSKAIASIPGAAYVIGKISEFEKLKDYPGRTAYLNLYKFYTYMKDIHQTPNTPAVQTFFALDQALTNILNKGTTKNHEQLTHRAEYMRAGLKKLGLRFLLDESDMSVVLTTVIAPQGWDIEKLLSRLRDYHIICYRGKGPLTGKVFQVATIGEITLSDIDYFLETLKTILKGRTTLSHKTPLQLTKE